MYCHLNVKTGTRADGQSAVAKYAYISRTGKYAWGFHDDVVHVESGNMPYFATSDPRLYWSAADEYERSNGRLFRSLTAALPNALDFDAQLMLARSFAVDVTGGELPYTLALHAGDVNRGGTPDNPHLHLVFSERVNDGVLRSAEDWFRRAAAKGRDPSSGGARKSTRTKPREWLIETRHAWAAHMNRAFERAGVADRATADSHWTQVTRAAVAGDVMEMERLLLNPPPPHIGPAAKHRWDDRDLEEMPDRYAQHEEAVAAAWEIWWAHTKDVAESEMGWTQVAELDARIGVLEAEQRVEDAAAERERERLEAERREADEQRRIVLEEREAAVDVTSQGRAWRMDTQQEVLDGADRPPTLDERERVVEKVERLAAAEEKRHQVRIVSAARSALLTDAAIEHIRVAAEEEQTDNGWAAVEKETVARLERKQAAESAAEEIGLTAGVVYACAQEENGDGVAMLEQTIAIFMRVRPAGLGINDIAVILREAENRQGSGWLTAVEASAAARVERKAAAEAAAQDAGVDVAAACETAEFLSEDRVAFLEGATEIAAEAHGVLLSGDAVRDIHAAAESEARGSGWRAVKAATAVHLERKQLAETRAHEAGITDCAAVYAAAQSRNADPVAALEEATNSALRAAEERERQLGADLAALRERRCEGVSVGGEWFYTRKLAELERGQRQSSPEHREQALAWAGWQMDRLDSLREENALGLFFRKLEELGAGQRTGDIEGALDDAEEQLRQAAKRRQGQIEALSKDERIFFAKKLDALESSWRETGTAQSANIDDALDYARTQLDALDRDIERRRMDIHGTRGDGYARLLQAGFESESRQRKVRALTTVETYLHGDFDRQEEKIRTHAAGEAFLRRGRVEVLGADRQPETLVERSDVIVAAAAYLRQAEAERREARHQMVSGIRGGSERLRAAGWDQARADDEKDQALTTVERDLTADFDRREKALRTDNQGDEFLRRARLAVLVADREAATLAERGRVIERAEMDREAARRQQEEEAARRRGEEAARQQEEERQRRELAGREVAIRATSSGSQRLDAERRAKFGTTKRSLSVDEETSIVEVVELQVTEDLAQRETEVTARVGGKALLRAVPKRRGQAASSGSLAEREETVMAVEQRLRAADAVEALLPATAPDPTRLDYRVPAVSNAALDQAVTADEPLFVQDVVFLLRERYAHRAHKRTDEGGYDATARDESERRYLGSALASALQWCVLKLRELILKACHKVLGGRGESGERVQASLATAGADRQTHQRTAESAAAEVGIDVEAFCEAARADGRDQVAVLAEETARRQQMLAAAAAVGVDYRAEYAAAEKKTAGSGFDAIAAATGSKQRAAERQQEAESTARGLGINVDAVCAAARSKGADPLAALAKETARCQEIISYAEAIDFPRQRFDAVWDAAEARRPGSGYTAVRAECVRTKAREEVLKVLPFEGPDRARPGALVVAVSSEPSRDLLQQVEDDEFVHGILSEVQAELPGSAEQREQAEDFYHQRQTKIEYKKLEKDRSGWFSSTPTKEEAKQSVLERFVPTLAARVRKACDVHDLDSLRVRASEEDRVRRVVAALATALPQGKPYPGYPGSSSSQKIAVSDERLNRIVARTRDTFIKDVIASEFLEGLSFDAYGRSRAEEDYLDPRIRKKEQSGLRREQAEAAVHEEYDVELLRRIEAVCREVQLRPAAEVWRERARAKAASASPNPAVAPSPARGAGERARSTDRNWSR